MVTKGELTRRIKNACRSVCEIEEELTDDDSFSGNADLGLEMVKICKAIERASEESADGIKELLDDAAMAVMVLDGGSAVSLWYSWLEALEKAAPDYEEMSEEELKNMFARALQEIGSRPEAEQGGGEMVDVLTSATSAVVSTSGSASELFRVAAAAAENSRRLSSSARGGVSDAGAAGAARFFAGLAK